jgi:hypothetical protein
MNRSRLVTVVAAGAFLVAAEGAAALPVGHTVKQLEVPGTAANELRKVDVHLWYPAATATGPVTVYKSALQGKALPAQFDPMAWSLQSKLAREDAAIDTTSAKPFPVVVFSHGSVNDPHNEATMLEMIAAAGFVVASPSHVTDTQDDVRIDFINTQAGSTLFRARGPARRRRRARRCSTRGWSTAPGISRRSWMHFPVGSGPASTWRRSVCSGTRAARSAASAPLPEARRGASPRSRGCGP